MGKKYVIELEDDPFVCFGNQDRLWRAKGFNSLVFDENGLKKLKPYKGVSSTKYAEDMEWMQEVTWNLARDIFNYWNEEDINGTFSIQDFFAMRPEEASTKFYQNYKNWNLTYKQKPKGEDGDKCEQVIVEMLNGKIGTGWRNGTKDTKPWFILLEDEDHIIRYEDIDVFRWRKLPK